MPWFEHQQSVYLRRQLYKVGEINKTWILLSYRISHLLYDAMWRALLTVLYAVR